MPRKKALPKGVDQLLNKRYRARFMLNGTPRTRVFDTAEAAEKWIAAEKQYAKDADPLATDTKTTVRAAVERELDSMRDRIGKGGERGLKVKYVRDLEGFAQRAIYFARTTNGLVLGDMLIRDLRYGHVKAWLDKLPAKPTQNARAYGLLKQVCDEAIKRGELAIQPCTIKGAATAKAVHEIQIPDPEVIGLIADKIAPRYKLMVLLAAWCFMRKGEVTDIRVSDFDLDGDRPSVTISHAVTWVRDQAGAQVAVVSTPKSRAGTRTIPLMRQFLVPEIRNHIVAYGQRDADLLFPAAGDPAKHLATSSLYKVYYRARALAGVPKLHFHDLRHAGGSYATAHGKATVKEVMALLGHETPDMAMHYQHVLAGRLHEVAAEQDRYFAERAKSA